MILFMRYFNVMHFVNIIIFRPRNIFRVVTFSGKALLNWFTKSSKFSDGFNNNGLLRSFPRSFYCTMLLSQY